MSSLHFITYFTHSSMICNVCYERTRINGKLFQLLSKCHSFQTNWHPSATNQTIHTILTPATTSTLQTELNSTSYSNEHHVNTIHWSENGKFTNRQQKCYTMIKQVQIATKNIY